MPSPLAHLLRAISGYHVGIIQPIGLAVGRRTARTFKLPPALTAQPHAAWARVRGEPVTMASTLNSAVGFAPPPLMGYP